MTFKERLLDVWRLKRPDIKSQRKLEDAIGLSNGAISKWDNSEPSRESQQKIADFFKMPIDELVGNDVENASGLSPVQKDIAAHIDPDTPEEERRAILEYVELLKQSGKYRKL